MRFVCILFCAFMLLSTGSSIAQTAAPLTPLRVISTPVDDVTPALYALKTGMFRAAGLDVSIDGIQSGSAAAAAVVGGSADIGKEDILSFVVAHAHGIPLTLVAPAALHGYVGKWPASALVVAAGSPIKSAKDFAGKTVGVQGLGSLFTLAIQNWINNNGGDWHATKFVEMPYSSLLLALEQDRIQATVLLIPFLQDAVTEGKATILVPVVDYITPRFPASVWFSNNAYVASHPAVIAAFRRVVAQAAVYTNAHPAETLPLLIAFTGMAPAKAANMARMESAVTFDPAQVQPIIDVAAKFGRIPRRFDAREIAPR